MNSYSIIRKVHLYASLTIVVLVLMYVVSSYLMIHSQWFKPYQRAESEVEVSVEGEDLTGDDLTKFLTENNISGKLQQEKVSVSGGWTRKYTRAGKEYTLTYLLDQDKVIINTRIGNTSAILVGLHGTSGFEGPWQYQIYASLLDVAGINLVLFAITGAFLWLNLLKKDRIAWIIFITGLCYVSLVIAYLAMA